MRHSMFLAAVAMLATAAVAPGVPEKELADARQTAKQLMMGTRTLLEAQVQAHGAAGALGACAREAQEMSRAVQPKGWSVRRVSTKVRNAADRPDAWERRQLVALETAHRATPLAEGTEVAEVVTARGRRSLRYLKPIVIPGPLCLQCHGDRAALTAAVRDSLARLYPRDRAVGYRAGDFRGAVSVTIPLSH